MMCTRAKMKFVGKMKIRMFEPCRARTVRLSTLRDVSFSHTKSKRTSSFSHIIKVIESMMCVFFILSI